jgi:hypothetical protein
MQTGTAARTAKVLDSGRTLENTEVPELHPRIALRAYQIYEERGSVHGNDLDNWLRAEQEILGEKADSDFG